MIGMERDVCDAVVDAVIRRYFLPLPSHVSIRDRDGQGWISARASPARLVETVEHHLRGEPLNRSFLLCDYDGVIDWPIVIGVLDRSDDLQPMPCRRDLESQGVFEEDWQAPDRVPWLQVDGVLGVHGGEPPNTEKVVVERMKSGTSKVSITPVGLGRQFPIDVPFQSRDAVLLDLLRAGTSSQPVRVFGSHPRMGTGKTDEFVLTDCLKISIDEVDVRDHIAEVEAGAKVYEEEQKAREEAQRRAQERRRGSQPTAATRVETDDLFSLVLSSDQRDGSEKDLDAEVAPCSNSNPKAAPAQRADRRVGKREFLLTGHLPGCKPRETVVFAAVAFRHGSNPTTGELNVPGNVWEIPTSRTNLKMIAETAGIANLDSVEESLAALLKDGHIENRNGHWVPNPQVIGQKWKDGQRIKLPAELLDGPSTIHYEHTKKDGTVVNKTMRRSPTALLVLGWMEYNKKHLEHRAVNGTLLAGILGLKAKTVREVMLKLSKVGLLQTIGWKFTGKEWIRWRRPKLPTDERNGSHRPVRNGSHRT